MPMLHYLSTMHPTSMCCRSAATGGVYVGGALACVHGGGRCVCVCVCNVVVVAKDRAAAHPHTLLADGTAPPTQVAAEAMCQADGNPMMAMIPEVSQHVSAPFAALWLSTSLRDKRARWQYV